MRSQTQGDAPWFVRERRGRGCNLRPHGRAGWLITLLYTLAVTGMSVLLLAREEPAMAEIVSWGLITTAMTAAFLIIAWRTSAPTEGTVRSCRAKAGGDPKLALVIALLSAAAIIGAALLGIEI